MALKKIFQRKPKKPKDPNQLTILEFARQEFNRFVNWMFSTSEANGRGRRWLVIVVVGVVWAFSAYGANPFQPGQGVHQIAFPFETLFAAETFRHVIVFFLAFYAALQIAANYLADVFELKDISIAEKYLLQAALADRYPMMEIREGKVVSDVNSTILKIGGPGLVKVNLDSAALFEKYDGDPTVIAPTDGLVVLDRFERLRKTVSLRDHVAEMDVAGRTKDGITVIANGVRMKYHVNRGGVEPTLKAPYPFDREAIQTLVYKESVANMIDSLVTDVPKTISAAKLPEHPEILKLTPGPFVQKLQQFIASATLSEFLAQIGEREIRHKIEETDNLQVEANSLIGDTKTFDDEALEQDTDGAADPNGAEEATAVSPSGNGTGEAEKPSFYTRDVITNRIYQENDEQDRKASGLQLDWIDIGTWTLPENASKIMDQHEEAWEQSLKNLAKKSMAEKNSIRVGQSGDAAEDYVRDIIVTFREGLKTISSRGGNKALQALLRQNRQSNEDKATRDSVSEMVYGARGQNLQLEEAAELVDKILHVYRAKLVSAKDIYDKKGEIPPERLTIALHHIDELLGFKRWV